MQNAFVEEDGTYESAEARQMIPRLEKLIGFAREHGMPLIWTQSDHRPPYGGIMLRKFPTIREDRVLWKDDPSFELYADMPQPLPDEHRVVKHKYDAFFETDLDGGFSTWHRRAFQDRNQSRVFRTGQSAGERDCVPAQSFQLQRRKSTRGCLGIRHQGSDQRSGYTFVVTDQSRPTWVRR